MGDCSFIGDRGSLLIDWERGTPPFQLTLVLKHQSKACLSESGGPLRGVQIPRSSQDQVFEGDLTKGTFSKGALQDRGDCQVGLLDIRDQSLHDRALGEGGLRYVNKKVVQRVPEF